MKRTIERYYESEKWIGFYTYKLLGWRSNTNVIICPRLSFDKAYEIYLTHGAIDLSGDMEHFRTTRKIRVPSGGIKW